MNEQSKAELEKAIAYFESDKEREKQDGDLEYINFDERLNTILQAAKKHDERVTELLASNNRLLARARMAEEMLQKLKNKDK